MVKTETQFQSERKWARHLENITNWPVKSEKKRLNALSSTQLSKRDERDKVTTSGVDMFLYLHALHQGRGSRSLALMGVLDATQDQCVVYEKYRI